MNWFALVLAVLLAQAGLGPRLGTCSVGEIARHREWVTVKHEWAPGRDLRRISREQG
jgi:hypothetical protein